MKDDQRRNQAHAKPKSGSKKKSASSLDNLSKALSVACLVMLIFIIGIVVSIGMNKNVNADPFSTTKPSEETTTGETTTEETTTEETTTEETTYPEEEGYTSVNETVWTTTELNIRKGPGTSYEKVGRLASGFELKRIAIGENGWSKVIFHEEICYASSEYLTATKPVSLEELTESDRITVDPTQENWNLIVVNHTREIPEGYTPKLAAVAGSDIYLDYRVAPHYTEMYNAAKKDGITLTPYSGYRSYDRQKNNYNNRINNNIANGMSREDAVAEATSVILPPGTSEHNLGLAMDICNTKNSFKNQKEYAWLVENAHKYGFILRYTEEKKSVTGIVAEPWHWRYVGVEYAEKIKNSGLCLEEYLDSVGIAY